MQATPNCLHNINGGYPRKLFSLIPIVFIAAFAFRNLTFKKAFAVRQAKEL